MKVKKEVLEKAVNFTNIMKAIEEKLSIHDYTEYHTVRLGIRVQLEAAFFKIVKRVVAGSKEKEKDQIILDDLERAADFIQNLSYKTAEERDKAFEIALSLFMVARVIRGE